MTSLGSILEIAKSGLIASQQAMNITAHNIANAGTDGYSRQRPLMVGQPAVRLAGGIYGNGVSIQDVQRVADPMLDAALFRQVSNSADHGARADVLRRVESLFGEPSDTGLGASLDAFFSTFSDLASNSTSAPVRTALRQTSNDLADNFQSLAAGLDALRQETEARMQGGIDRVNTLLGDVAHLNQQIVSSEVGGQTAGDLRDERGRRLAELAELVPIHVIERDDGSLGVTSSGVTIVDRVYSATLELRQTAGVWTVAKVGTPAVFPDRGGQIGGLLDFVNNDLPTVRQELDDLAEALVTEVNALHVTGTNPTGATGVFLFDPAGITASNIALSADVTASADAIAAGTPDGGGAYRAGANDVALAIAGLRDVDAPSLGMPMTTHYDSLVLDIGSGVRSSADAAQVHRTLADQAEVRRMSLSGVSVDEELVKMIEFQTAYQASARVISAADEMLQSLLAM